MEDAEMDDRLYRSTDDRMLAGVAGGLAEMWDADPSVVRIVWALLAFFTGGIALLVYIVMAIVVPERPDAWEPAPADAGAPTAGTPAAGTPATGQPAAGTPATGQPVAANPAWSRAEARAARARARAARRAERRRGPSSVGVVFGGLLIVIGVVFLIRQWLPQIDFDWLWPVMLIALGILLLVAALERGHDTGRPPAAPGAGGTPGPSGTSGGPA
jgi:phage shock protein C